MAREHVTTQHKPVVFVLRMQKKKQTKNVGHMTIQWWRCKDDVAVEYMERVTVKYKELSEEVGGWEEEWIKVQRSICGSCRGAMWKNIRKGRNVKE